MTELDYGEVLIFLLARLEESAPELRRAVVDAIDAGKEVPDVRSERAIRRDRYRTERLTDAEALVVAFNVLSSYFEELPRVLASIEQNFRLASLGVGESQYEKVHWTKPVTSESSPASIVIEQRTAERFSQVAEFWNLNAPRLDLIEEQSRNLDRVFRLAEIDREVPWLR